MGIWEDKNGSSEIPTGAFWEQGSFFVFFQLALNLGWEPSDFHSILSAKINLLV